MSTRARQTTDAPAATLTVAGADRIREVFLDARGVIIGRDPQCDVVLDDERVSRRHARIFQDPFGRWIIEDLGSHTGVIIAGRRIDAHALLPGERVTIGSFTLMLTPALNQPIAPDPSASATSTTLLTDADDLDVVHAGPTPPAALSRIWLHELNRIVDRLAHLASPAELYSELCRQLATASGTVALVVRLPESHTPLPASPEVLACHVGGRAPAADGARTSQLHLSRRVLEAVRCAGQPVMARNARHADGELSLTISDLRGLRAVICAAVSEIGATVDALYLDLPFGESARDIFEFTQALARQVQLVRNSLLLSELRAEQCVLNHQLALAHDIQARLVPRTLPRVSGVDVALYYKPAMWVGGDYCDVWQLPDGRLALAIGDVCGKGLPAALVMANLQAALRTAATFSIEPCEMLRRVNQHLVRHTPEGMFVTLFLALLDPAAGQLEYVNAGHIPPLVRTPAGQVAALAEAGDTVLGLRDGAFASRVHAFPAGMALVAVTDGITEACSCAGEEFGTDGLENVLGTSALSSARQVVRAVADAVAEFRGPTPARDDVTIVALVRLPFTGRTT